MVNNQWTRTTHSHSPLLSSFSPFHPSRSLAYNPLSTATDIIDTSYAQLYEPSCRLVLLSLFSLVFCFILSCGRLSVNNVHSSRPVTEPNLTSPIYDIQTLPFFIQQQHHSALYPYTLLTTLYILASHAPSSPPLLSLSLSLRLQPASFPPLSGYPFRQTQYHVRTQLVASTTCLHAPHKNGPITLAK